MAEDEIIKSYNKLELGNKGYKWRFEPIKEKLLTYNIIAWHNNKKLKITRITENKCISKIITTKGLDVSRFYIQENYNDNLEHKNGKVKIIDFEII